MLNRISKALGRLLRPPPVVSVIRLAGPIGDFGRFNRGLDDASLAPLIDRAFNASRLKAVALSINSPGGAATQSALIASRIRDAANEKEVPVFAFCEDVAASGGYMLACAADEIYAEENSIVGSIGVVSAAFGFTAAIDKLGVERRVRTAGVNKVRLDPFQPEKPEDVEWLLELQSRIHENFIARVKASRGDRLGEKPDPEVFSGEVWVGQAALDRGLIDGIGRIGPVMRAKFGGDVRFVPVARRRGLLASLGRDVSRDAADLAVGRGGDLPAEFASALISEVEHRALWARYGL